MDINTKLLDMLDSDFINNDNYNKSKVHLLISFNNQVPVYLSTYEKKIMLLAYICSEDYENGFLPN